MYVHSNLNGDYSAEHLKLLEQDALQYSIGFPFDQAYNALCNPQIQYQDASLIVMLDAQTPVVGLQATLARSSDGKLFMDFNGRDMMVRRNAHIDVGTLKKAEKLLATAFLDMWEQEGRPPYTFLETTMDGMVSEFCSALLSAGGTAQPVLKQIVDLDPDEQTLRQAVRKRFKSHINWGLKHLDIKVFEEGSVQPDTMEQFRQLHIDVAGRETRSQESWERQQYQIETGSSFAVFGYLEDRLVTANLITQSPRFCCYGVGASRRELFDKPISHAIMWTCILTAKKRGCRFLEIGDLVHLMPGTWTDKEKDISVFKKGFGGDTRTFLKVVA